MYQLFGDVVAFFREWSLSLFRVGRYDYPFCSSCNVAPCDYVQAEEFEQVCHISKVPCGSCLWSTGVSVIALNRASRLQA